MCFGGRKTREERKLWLKIHLFGFPQRLVTSWRQRPLARWFHSQLWLVHLNLSARCTLHRRETYILPWGRFKGYFWHLYIKLAWKLFLKNTSIVIMYWKEISTEKLIQSQAVGFINRKLLGMMVRKHLLWLRNAILPCIRQLSPK